MGQFLEKPKTEKTIDKGEGPGIRFGVSAMQGWRTEMEDSHVCKTDLEKLKGHSFFGIFDGHAGTKVSQFSSNTIMECIMKCIEKNKGDGEITLDVVKKGVYRGFLDLDEKMKKSPPWSTGEDMSGTTAIVVMITPEKIIWGNCGDSRGLLCSKSEVKFATEDHKPFNEIERKRIEKAGGTVIMQRVNGSLAVSRALGDFNYKRSGDLDPTEQLVSPEPEITVLDRDLENDEFLLLACDGIFDVMKNEEVVAYVRHRLSLTDDLSKICSDLIDACLNKNSKDNMSVVLVTFQSAPKVSKEAIDEEKKLQERAMHEITSHLEELTKEAQDVLDLDEGEIFRKLLEKFPEEYCLIDKRQYVIDKVGELKKDKFGVTDDFDQDFSGSDDPTAFHINYGGNKIVITPEVDNPQEQSTSESIAVSPPNPDCTSTTTDSTSSSHSDAATVDEEQKMETQNSLESKMSST